VAAPGLAVALNPSDVSLARSRTPACWFASSRLIRSTRISTRRRNA